MLLGYLIIKSFIELFVQIIGLVSDVKQHFLVYRFNNVDAVSRNW